MGALVPLFPRQGAPLGVQGSALSVRKVQPARTVAAPTVRGLDPWRVAGTVRAHERNQPVGRAARRPGLILPRRPLVLEADVPRALVARGRAAAAPDRAEAPGPGVRRELPLRAARRRRLCVLARAPAPARRGAAPGAHRWLLLRRRELR